MARIDERTPVSIVTGFLGSGKTTLLNRALSSPRLANAAMVINEFGSVPLDHMLSEASDDQIVLLENGCLCCTVFGNLIAALNRLYHRREAGEIRYFDRVIIETSGLADPRPVLQAFLSDPTLEGLYRLDSVLAVLDAVNGPGTLARHDESVHQLATADRILISKLDLLGIEQLKEAQSLLRRRVRELNPSAILYMSCEPELDWVELLTKPGFSLDRRSTEVLAWLNVSAYDSLPQASGRPEEPPDAKIPEGADCSASTGRHGGPKISSFCLVRQEPTSLYGLELLLAAVERNLGPALLRLKGLVNVRERAGMPAVIHGAQHLLHNMIWLERWPSDDHSTRIVFITTGIGRAELEEIVELLDRIARRTALARDGAQSRVARE